MIHQKLDIVIIVITLMYWVAKQIIIQKQEITLNVKKGKANDTILLPNLF